MGRFRIDRRRREMVGKRGRSVRTRSVGRRGKNGRASPSQLQIK